MGRFSHTFLLCSSRAIIERLPTFRYYCLMHVYQKWQSRFFDRLRNTHPSWGGYFYGMPDRIRTCDRWLLVRMDAEAFRLIFWHSSQYLCSSILHNHALVDAYPISLCKRGNSRHTKTDKQFTAPVYASKVIDSMVPALAKFNAWLYVSFPSRTIFFVSSRDALAIIARSVMTTPAGYPPKLPISAHRIL